MCRRLIRGLVLATGVALLVLPPALAGVTDSSSVSPLLDRFLARDDPDPTDFRALRHLEAANDTFDSRAWMDVWTEVDRGGFRYQIAGEGGSDYIRSKVFRATLERERQMWRDGSFNDGAVTPTNYVFRAGRVHDDGLASLIVKPRRKDMLLVDGAIFLNPDDADLVRVEGRLAKTPSFWTRRVDIVRRFRRYGAVRLPASLDAVASVLIAGRSTFTVTYEYERVNGTRVGTPQPRLAFINASARQ